MSDDHISVDAWAKITDTDKLKINDMIGPWISHDEWTIMSKTQKTKKRKQRIKCYLRLSDGQKRIFRQIKESASQGVTPQFENTPHAS